MSMSVNGTESGVDKVEEQSKSPPWPYSAALPSPLAQAEVKPPPKSYSESAAQNRGAMGGGGSSL
eukprot:2074777-Karenia_brevis.AAC.1